VSVYDDLRIHQIGVIGLNKERFGNGQG